jgi:hypothetical protein
VRLRKEVIGVLYYSAVAVHVLCQPPQRVNTYTPPLVSLIRLNTLQHHQA